MLMRFAQRIVAASILLGGCMRGGFDPYVDGGHSERGQIGEGHLSGDGAGQGDGAGRGDGAGQGDAMAATLHATVAHDTCAQALTIDLQGLASPISVEINTTGAKKDGACTETPDLFLKLLHPPSMLGYSCTAGSGSLRMLADTTGTCPPTVLLPGAQCVLQPCIPGSGSEIGLLNNDSVVSFQVDRDPSEGPVVVTFSKGAF